MGATSFLFRRNATHLDTIGFDAVVAETHASSSELTRHPVEAGANITDHIRPNPASLKLSCVLSDTPLGGLPAPGRSRDVYAQIERLKETGTIITVTTQLRQYENMVIADLGVPVDAKTADGIEFTVTLAEIRTVRSKTAPVRTLLSRHAKKVSFGKLSAKAAGEATVGKAPINQSFAISIIKAISGK